MSYIFYLIIFISIQKFQKIKMMLEQKKSIYYMNYNKFTKKKIF